MPLTTHLKSFLEAKADELIPFNPELPERQEYYEHVNDDALSDAWLERGTSYIWKVGVLAQIDSNKCDHVHLLIGHEREPGHYQFVGMLFWVGGENDDIGRCLQRYLNCASMLHPVFEQHGE